MNAATNVLVYFIVFFINTAIIYGNLTPAAHVEIFIAFMLLIPASIISMLALQRYFRSYLDDIDREFSAKEIRYHVKNYWLSIIITFLFTVGSIVGTGHLFTYIRNTFIA